MSHKKLVTLAVAALLIVVVIWLGYATNREVVGIVHQQFNEQQLLFARQSAAGIESFLEEKINLIEVLAEDSRDVSPEGMAQSFIPVYNTSSGFFAIQFINTAGVVVSGYPAEDTPVGFDLYAANRSWPFDDARDRKETCIIDPVPLFEGGLGSYAWVPVYDDNEFKGVILAVVRISTLSDQFLVDAIPEGQGYMYMIDHSGRSLYDGVHKKTIGEKYIGSFCTNDSSYADILREQMRGNEGTGYYFDEITGERQIVAYTPVVWGDRVWSVAVSVPASKAVELIRQVYRGQTLFVTIVIAIILAGSGGIILIFSRWNRALEKEVVKKTDDLKRSNIELASANTKLRELDRLKSEFVSMVSHELKTPLTSIKISMDVLKSLSGSRKDADTEKEMLQIIDRSIERQKRLVSDLLDISRIDTGNLKLNLEPVDLYEIILESKDSMKKIADEQGIPIHTDLGCESMQITGDYDRLVQVFVNLIGNALKFTSEGEIRIRTRMVDGHPEIKVIDTGIGIPAEELDQIFDKFHQVDSGLTREVGGSGLGLAICKGIIEGHGGTIRAESEFGKGSTFVIVL
ncbi:MAG: sensor histidine kinase [Euryarchaeota archaeon]|nr:sensor histidine kinase [Euryarchaeota archaeon]